MGGHAWVYANWSFGLRANGCDVVWIERFAPDTSPDDSLRLLRVMREHLDEIGLDVTIALILTEDEHRRFQRLQKELSQLTVPRGDVARETDLLLDFYYELEPQVLRFFRRTALVDIDPGLLQWWIAQGQLQVAKHDLYFRIGETVGTAAAKFPDCGLPWHYTPPAVFLPAWPITPTAAGAPYTTVSTWWAKWEDFGGETFSNEKRTSFLDYAELPSKTSARLELTLCMLQTEQADISHLGFA